MEESNLICDVCGQNDFMLKDGFYYCNECGTQTQQIRDVEVESGVNEDAAYANTKKIKILTEKPELTSWECFNYLLRGLVEELIELGAKEELKVVTLQLWAAFLRKSEVAFYDKKQTKLPKLGPRFSPRDVKILYNHDLKKKKRRKRFRTANTSENPNVTWKKQKRKLMEAEYESLSTSQQTFSQYSTSASLRSSSAASVRAIRLEFTQVARKYFKKLMPKSHLAKHEVDGDLECHTIKPISTDILPQKFQREQLSRKTIYTILYLALNLIEDEIQLSDVLRFMREGHLSSSNISHMFPENVAESCENLIHSRQFGSRRHVFLDSVIRYQATLLCKFIYIPQLKTPNIYKLSVRFLTDLCLPKRIAIFLERLINLCPPEMKNKFHSGMTPCYEGRAMAYIIFVLKLLFGLDDIKEEAISQSAKEINEKLKELNCLKKKKLFVWDEWRRYIEMRNIILCQCHLPTSLAAKQFVNPSHYIDQLKFEQGVTEEDVVKSKRRKLLNMERVFESFQMNYRKEIQHTPSETLKFPPSLTPNRFYLEKILENPPESVYIPGYMWEDHAETLINSFLKPSELKEFFKEHLIQLDVVRMECNPNRNFVEVFRNFDDAERKRNFQCVRKRKLVFDIEEEEWLEEIRSKGPKNIGTIKKQSEHVKIKPLTFKERLLEMIANITQENAPAKESGIDNSTLSTMKKKLKLLNAKPLNLKETLQEKLKVGNNKRNKQKKSPAKENGADNNTDLLSLKSFDVFNEADMLPLEGNLISEPRKNLEEDDLFADVSDDEISNHSDTGQVFDEKLEFVISNLDYWILFGNMINLPNLNFLEVKSHMPSNFLWLLETCSNMIGIECGYLYQELLTIENYFTYVLEPIDKLTNILTFKTEHISRDLANEIERYKLLW